MTTAPDLHRPIDFMPTHVGGHPIAEPRGGQLWCESNMGLFTTLLEVKPPAADRAAMHAYREGIDVARDMCSRLCPRFEECLKAATTGPPIDGFVAGTTPSERQRHREHLRVEATPEIVNDRFVGLEGMRKPATDYNAIDATIQRMPHASAAQIAMLVAASTSTVKRRKRALAEQDAGDGDAATTAGPEVAEVGPSMEAHVDTYYLIREATETTDWEDAG